MTAKRPDCPITLAQVLNGCLKKDPKDRYQRAEHVLKDLVRVETGRPPMGPASLGESSQNLPPSFREAALAAMGAPPPPPENETKARGTRKSPRATRTAAAVSTVVGLPPEARPRRIRWRALVPKTWPGQLAAAGALVIAVLLFISAALARWRSAPAGEVAAVAMQVDAGPDTIAIAWTSASAFQASASATKSEGGAAIEVGESAPATAHQLKLAGLERGASYAVVVKSGERVLFRTTVKTPSPSDFADRVAAAIHRLDPASLAAKLEAELWDIPPRERFPGSPKLAVVRDRWAALVKGRQTVQDVDAAIARFRDLRHDFFLSDSVAPERKIALWLALEALEDLRLLAASIGVEGLPRGVEQLSGAGFGPLPDFSIAGATVQNVDLRHPSRDLKEGPEAETVMLYTSPGTPDFVMIKNGSVKGLHSETSLDLPRPLVMPAGAKRLEIGIATNRLAPLTHVTLLASREGGRPEPVAVFRGNHETTAWSHVALDPRLLEGRRMLRLEFHASEAMTPPKFQLTTVKELELRYLAGGAP